MDIWKGVMRLNAKAFCLLTFVLLGGTAVWCGFRLLTPPTPFQEGNENADLKNQPLYLDTLDYVSNQIADVSVVIPADPFRPTIEAIFTNETERMAFLQALKAAEAASTGFAAENTAAEKAAAAKAAAAALKKKDPFAQLRKKSQIPGRTIGPNGMVMVKPRIRYEGFIQRPDGTKAAMFYDSSAKTSFFYEPGKKVHGVEIENADVKQAKIKFPDGTSRNLKIGGFVELAAEPMKIRRPKFNFAKKPNNKDKRQKFNAKNKQPQKKRPPERKRPERKRK